MISNCANPECSVPLRYLRHGRIFRFDIPLHPFANKSNSLRKVSHFWLCGRCCQHLTLVLDVFGMVNVRKVEEMVVEVPVTIPLTEPSSGILRSLPAHA